MPIEARFPFNNSSERSAAEESLILNLRVASHLGIAVAADLEAEASEVMR